MATIGDRGAAERVGQRLRPIQGRRAAIGRQPRPALAIDGGALLDRQAVEDVVQVVFDVGQLVRFQDAFEDVEAAAPVGFENVGMQLA